MNEEGFGTPYSLQRRSSSVAANGAGVAVPDHRHHRGAPRHNALIDGSYDEGTESNA